MARPAMQPTVEQRRTVMQLASIGVPTEAIGHAIGEAGAPLDEKTIRRHFRAELDRGAALCTVRVQRKLHELIDQGNPAAIFFYLKCREGWREVQRIETTGAGGAPPPAPVFQAQLYLPSKTEIPPLADTRPGSLADAATAPRRPAQPSPAPNPSQASAEPHQAPRKANAEPRPARVYGTAKPTDRFLPSDPRR